MAAVATKEKVKIKLSQGLAGHRTRIIPAGNKSVRRQMDDGTVKDVLVEVPERVEVMGEFSYNPDQEIEWPADEAKRLVDKGIASFVTEKV